jgi:hypothetical protein
VVGNLQEIEMIEYIVKVRKDGTKEWYLDGELHRIEYYYGTKEWYKDGVLHREDGPAIEYADGTKVWYLNGELHREDGPAFEWPDGQYEWYLNGKLHRIGGPACGWPDGTEEWWLNGEGYSEKNYWNQLRPVKELTVAEIESLLGYSVKVVK